MDVGEVARERQLFEHWLLVLLGHGPDEFGDEAIGPTLPSVLLSLLVRRRFSGSDVREVTRYVAEVLDRCEIDNTGKQARAAEMLIRAELGEVGLVDTRLGSADEFAELIWLLVADLALEADLEPDTIGVLLDHAQRDADRQWAYMRDNALAPADLLDFKLRRWNEG
jgi:hypothetical protein